MLVDPFFMYFPFFMAFASFFPFVMEKDVLTQKNMILTSSGHAGPNTHHLVSDVHFLL